MFLRRRNALFVIPFTILLSTSFASSTQAQPADGTGFYEAAAASAKTRTAAGANQRALWVWVTESILKDSRKRKSLLEYCKQQNVGTIWLQLLYDLRQQPLDKDRAVCTLRYPREIRRLLREAHDASIAVHALDGFPEFALNEYHGVPTAIIKALLEFNADGEQAEHFDGVHFDNEPYAIVGWHAPAIREQIMTEFLVLNQKCKQMTDVDPNFEFGIDIPVWWHAEKSTAPMIADFAFDGKSKSLAMHCLETVDNLGIMNYRDSADGPDGIVANGKPILAAAKNSSQSIIMGVETINPPPGRVWLAIGMPREEFEYACEREDNALAWRSRFSGFSLRVFDDGRNVHVGLQVPYGQAFDAPDFQKALRTVVETYGSGNRAGEETRNIATTALAAAQKNPEYQEPRALALDINGFDTQQPGIFVKSIMLPRITFGDDGSRFDTELSKAETEFAKSPAFAGMAIHSFESALKLKAAKSAE